MTSDLLGTNTQDITIPIEIMVDNDDDDEPPVDPDPDTSNNFDINSLIAKIEEQKKKNKER